MSHEYNTNPSRSISVASNNSNKIKLNLVKKGGKQINQSMVSMVEKQPIKIPLKQITNVSLLKNSKNVQSKASSFL